MDRQNFENMTFDTLPERILCSNFRNCTFNASTTFERCNLIVCTFNAQCEFDRSNVIDEEEENRRIAEDERIRKEFEESNNQ